MFTSACPNKEDCGSCGWSHIPYEKQLKQKLSDINGSFALHDVDAQVFDILPSPKTAHYRNRMDFVTDFEGRVGMRMKGKWWKVIDNHHCFLADERIEELFTVVRQWAQSSGLSFFDRKAHTGLLRYAVIRSTTLGETMINIVTSAPEDESSTHKALEALAETAKPTTLLWSVNNTITDVSFGEDIRTVSGEGVIRESINGYSYIISPNAFFQTNPHAAAELQRTVQTFAGDVKDKTVLDLYCGSGFFTIPFATSAKRTIGVELNAEAIRDARINAEANAVNVEFHDAKTEEFDWHGYNADVVIIDPPRSGMHDKALEDILQAAPETLIYISCNYKHLARESVKLLEIYNIADIKAVDMFPHTPHVETVVKFTRK